jgi:hypothetical protein
MHWWMWSADGDLYTVDDDGRNFGSPWNFAQLMRVQGTPPEHEVSLVTQFPELVRPAGLRCRRYVDGALAVGERLHVAVYDYDDEIAGFEDQWLMVDRVSPHGGVAGIMFSDDAGRSWHNVPHPSVGPDEYFLGPPIRWLELRGVRSGKHRHPAHLDGYA